MEHKGDLHPQIIIEDERGQSLEVHYIPEKAHLGSPRKPAGLGRHAARQDAARSGRHAGHHRRSAARHRNLRGAPAARPGGHGRDRRPRPPRREPQGQALDHRRGADRRGQADRRGARAPGAARQAAARPHRRLRQGRRPAGRWPAGAARHPAHQRHRGGAGLPGARGAVGLPQPARGHRRQAHRDHHLADAAQGEGRDDGRHRACCPARSSTSSPSARSTIGCATA